jgi:hypothetical protein
MQDLVWANLPWDWNLMDDMFVEGVAETPVVSGSGTATDGQVNGNTHGQQGESMGMPVL